MKKKDLKNVIIIFGMSILAFFACNEKNDVISESASGRTDFLISTEFSDSAEACGVMESFRIRKYDTLYIESSVNEKNRKNFRLFLGYFNDYETAARKGLQLVFDSTLSDFDVFSNGEIQNNYLRNFYFVGKYLDRPALVKYDLVKKKKTLIWSPWGRKIITFLQSDDLVNSYFITVYRIGNKVSFPFMTKVKIYHFNREDEAVNDIEFLGKNQRIQAEWTARDTFRVMLTSLDSIYTSIVYRKTFKYLSNGTRVFSDSLKFNLLRDGYPSFPRKEAELTSPNRQYKIVSMSDTTGVNYQLFNLTSASFIALDSLAGRIAEVKWDELNKRVYIVTFPDDSVTDTSLLYGFDIARNEKILNVERPGNVTLSFFGPALFYDYGKGDKKSIRIYDVNNRRDYSEIKVKGGCGINSINMVEDTGK